MTLEPIMPMTMLIILAVLTVGGCIALAVLTPPRRTRWLLRAVALVLLFLAALRPGTPVQASAEVPVAAVDVFVLVDTSASVVAEDWDGQKPRLEGIRADVDALLDQVPGARVSVIAFDSKGTVRVPLTTDHAAVRSAMEVLRPEPTASSAGSSVTAGKDALIDRLDRSAEQHPEAARYVFYFGDGEQTSGQEPASMSDVASRIDGGAVYGYGTAEGGRMKETKAFEWDLGDLGAGDPSPSSTSSPGGAGDGGPGDGGPGDGQQGAEEDPGYIQDPETRTDAVSTIDEKQLKTMADELGVGYTHRTAGTAFDAGITPDDLKTSLRSEETAEGRVDWFWIPLLGVFALLLIDAARALREVRSLARLHALLRRTP